MSKHIEKLKKQLVEISEVVNSFRSEAVQVRVVDRLLDVMIEFEKGDSETAEIFSKKFIGHGKMVKVICLHGELKSPGQPKC